MTEYKLTYFNGRGLGELPRWILHYGKIPFTDERVTMEEWPEKKKTVRGGKLPVLSVDGHEFPQSVAIARFLAKKTGLMPEDPLHAAYCDALVETLRDVVVDKFKIKNEEGKTEEEKMKKLKEEFVPNTLNPLIERISKRLEAREWFVGDKLSWGDICIGRIMEELYMDMPELATKFPKVKAHTEKVQNLPGIKEWIEKRPDTPW